ncbi:MAG TPA: LLM class flavin-dependent oxidoreductase [Bradyrhizobium sp.]|nr:LLM class flavin-dependent oxidoreductase [Bradyrhizobium sp.]
MRILFIHTMPYTALDMDYDRKHNSAWVTLPNDYYDSATGHELYNRYLDELEYADQLGFEGICVNEHHQTAFGLMPAPNIMAGALARRTKTAKICILGRALPLVNNPLTIAEEFAMLDTITGGRIVTGFVRGIGAEYHASGMNPTESLERYQEAHDLIVRAWTEKGPFTFEGKYYHFNHVNLWPRPFQNPHPPIWIPSQGSSETIRWAAAKERRYTYLQTQAPLASLYKYMRMYRDEARRSGYEPHVDQLGWAVKIYVAETDEIAMRESQPHIEAFQNKYFRMPMEMLLPPGYTSISSMKGVMEARKSNVGKPVTMHDMMQQGTFVCGSPATVRERLLEIQSKAGFNYLIASLEFGTLPAHLTRKNLEVFAREVMPHLRDAVPDLGKIDSLETAN